MLEDPAGGGPAPEAAERLPAAEQIISAHAFGILPAPDPEVAENARLRLAALSADWPLAQPPADPTSDVQAVEEVIRARSSAGALDVGAALVVLCDLRARLDGLEADLLDAVQQVDLSWDMVAAITGIPAEEVQRRHLILRARRGPGNRQPVT